MDYSDLCFEVTKKFISDTDIPYKDYKKFVPKHTAKYLGEKLLILKNLMNTKIF